MNWLSISQVEDVILVGLYARSFAPNSNHMVRYEKLEKLCYPELGQGVLDIAITQLREIDFLISHAIDVDPQDLLPDEDFANNHYAFSISRLGMKYIEQNKDNISSYISVAWKQMVIPDRRSKDKDGKQLEPYVHLHLDETEADNAGETIDTPQYIPASDRYVEINHNSQEHTDIESGIRKLKEAVLHSAEGNSLPEEIEAALSDLDAGLTLWQKSISRLKSLKETLLAGLKVFANEFKNQSIKKTASALITQILSFIGLG